MQKKVVQLLVILFFGCYMHAAEYVITIGFVSGMDAAALKKFFDDHKPPTDTFKIESEDTKKTLIAKLNTATDKSYIDAIQGFAIVAVVPSAPPANQPVQSAQSTQGAQQVPTQAPTPAAQPAQAQPMVAAPQSTPVPAVQPSQAQAPIAPAQAASTTSGSPIQAPTKEAPVVQPAAAPPAAIPTPAVTPPTQPSGQPIVLAAPAVQASTPTQQSPAAQPTAPSASPVPTATTTPATPQAAPTSPSSIPAPTSQANAEQTAPSVPLVIGILPPITKEEIKARSPEKKGESDALLTEILKKVALEVFLLPADEKKRIDKKEFNNGFDAYTYYVKNSLIDEVGNKEKFLYRQQLKDLLGDKDQPGGSFEKFVHQNLKVNGDLTLLLNATAKDLESLTDQLLALFAPCIYDIKAFESSVRVYIAYLLVNIVITQRPVTVEKLEKRSLLVAVANEGQQKKSDILAVDLFKEFLSAIKALVSKQVIAAQPKTDYIIWLAQRINALRLQTNFYKFANLLGSRAREGIIGSIELPLLELFVSNDKKLFGNANAIKSLIMNQLFFDEKNISQISEKELLDGLKLALDDHLLNMA